MEGLVLKLVNDFPWFRGLGFVPTALIVMLAAGFVVLNFFGLVSGIFTYFERKLAGWTNARRGPNRVGPYGLAQWIADGVKLVLKEDIIPAEADRPFFRFAPYLVLLGTALSFVVIPFGPLLIVSDLNVGVLYLLATGSFTVLGLIMAGWASNNKWSLLGGMRSAAQIVSYEVPNALVILAVVLSAGSMSVQGIIAAQAGGITHWFVFSSPFTFVAFFIYFISAIAEINRIPFDIPEAESELVAGYNIEYSGMRFGAFFAAEFGNIYVVSAIAVTCFLGGWQVPFVEGPGELASAGRAVGELVATMPAMLFISLLGMASAGLALYTLRAFLVDLRLKWPRFTDRHVRINTEWLALNMVFGGAALVFVLHWPFRAHLGLAYQLAFEYLLPFVVFFMKCMFISFVIFWWRWTLPRLRVDQLMGVCWRYLTPIAFVCLLGQAFWVCLVGS